MPSRAKAGAQPLASNSTLNDAADTQSQWMIGTDTFSHSGAGGATPTDRMTSAGYELSGSSASAENIGWVSAHDPAGLQDEVQQLHANLMNSPGHHANLMNPELREAGIGIADGDYKNQDAVFVTQDFAKSSTGPFLTGVAFADKDGDHSYDPGEGLGGIAVKATDAAGHAVNATTNDSGGYDLALSKGTYTVTFSGGAVAESAHQVTIADANVKLDLVDPAPASTQPETASHVTPASGSTETAPASDPGTSAAPVSDAVVAAPPETASHVTPASGSTETATASDPGTSAAPVSDVAVADPATADAGSGDATTPSADTQQPAEHAANPAGPSETTDPVAETAPTDPVSTHEDAPAGQADAGSPAHDLGQRVAALWQNLDRFDFRSDHPGSGSQEGDQASTHWDAQDVTDFVNQLQHAGDAQAVNVDQIVHEAVSHLSSELQSKCANAHDFFHI